MKARKITIIALTIALMLSGCSSSTLSLNGSTSESSASEEYSADETQLNDSEDGIDYSRALAKANQEFDNKDAALILSEENAVSSSLPREQKDYTVMVYMVGSNLESKLGNASKDLKEMEEAELSYDHVNLLVYAGGSRRWSSDVPSDKNSVLDMSETGQNRIVAQTAANADMGAPATLREFVNFSTDNYPADHYALIFWDHGGGPLWGFGSDELFDSDSLTVQEMREAMSGTIFAYGIGKKDKKLDFVGFDACLMGSIENMYMWSEFSNYYIGSEELEPGDGWDYHALSLLNRSTDPVTITGAVVDAYGSYYEGIASDTYNPDVTLACADLSVVKKVSESIGGLSKNLTYELDSGRYSDLQKTIGDVKSCGLVEDTKGGSGYSYDLIDLGSLAREMEKEAGKEAKALREALDDLIIKQYTNVEDTNGVTMYYPHANKGQFAKLQDAYSKVSVSEEYNAYLEGLQKHWVTARSKDWVIGELKDSDSKKDTILYKLTEDQMQNVAAVYYTVLKENSDGSYNTVMKNVQLPIERNGQVNVPKDPQVLCLLSDLGRCSVWPASQLESKRSRAVYKTDPSRLMNHLFLEYDSSSIIAQWISVIVSVENETGKISVQTINIADNDEFETGGKNTIDTEGWEGIYYTKNSLNPARDKNKTILPVSKWEGNGSVSGKIASLDKNFSFETRKLSELDGGDFSIQLVLEDVSGEQYASELFHLPVERGYRSVVQNTENGTISYEVYSDHAEVALYSGSDTELTIPDQVENVPVTVIQESALSKISIGSRQDHNGFKYVNLPDTVKEIGENAFRYCYELESIHMPASLERIGGGAFAECVQLSEVHIADSVTKIGKSAFAYCMSLENVQLPPVLEYFGEGVFLGCHNLVAITSAGKSPQGNVIVDDNFVLSKDQKTVLAYACGRTGEVTIPDDVTTIAYGAFSYSAVEKVVLPSTLREIDNFAFYNTPSLEVPVLPASLERIGSYAFGTVSSSINAEHIPKDRQEIFIGPNVNRLEKGAFDEFPARWFTVDDDNRAYSSVNGAVCNKAGDYLVYFSGNAERNYQVPNGVVTLDLKALDVIDSYAILDDSSGKVQLSIPSSVTTIINPDTFSNAYRIKVIHCSPGSVAEKYAQMEEIPCSFDSGEEFEEYMESTSHGKAVYRVYEDHATLVCYEGTDRTLNIVSSVKGKPVTMVGDGVNCIQDTSEFSISDLLSEDEASKESLRLKSVVIPGSVKIINANALKYLPMKEIILPEALEVIGDHALYTDTLPQIPDSVRYLGKEFLNCESDRGELVLPSNIEHIDSEAFAKLGKVTAFVIDDSNEQFSVREGVLYDKKGITLLAYPKGLEREDEALIIPEGTEKIGDYAFYRDPKITSVIIPEGVTEIGVAAFQGCSNLQSVVFPKGLTTIGDSAFCFCHEIRELVLPEGVKKIGDSAFSSCDKLENVVFPNSLITLESYAFYNCINLHAETFPENLAVIGNRAFGTYSAVEHGEREAIPIVLGPNFRSIGPYAFQYLQVTEFVVDDENPYFSDVDGLLTDVSETVLVRCPSGREGTLVIPDSIECVNDWAFRDSMALTDVVVPDSVTYINDSAFANNKDGSYPITIHCSEGSYAQKFAISKGIEYVLN